MSNVGIAQRANFEKIRYAQLWEDADVLTQALADKKGGTFLSICSAGDNALSLLTLEPKRVIALDLSMSQIECLHLRIAAFQTLSHQEFLALMGARESRQRSQLLSKALQCANHTTQEFWLAQEREVVLYGAAAVGKFERYFRTFKNKVLPWVHSQKTIDDIFISRSLPERERFFQERFNTWRWKLLLRVFFSQFFMARMGRDPAFFKHVQGSLASHLSKKIEHAAVTCDPSQNPYLHWIMKACHAQALPHAWREENYQNIANRLDRLEIQHCSIEEFVSQGQKFDGFNLSDIFEYMSVQEMENLYQQLLELANPQARFVYWNMMVPRQCPTKIAHIVKRLSLLERELKQRDKAFFYADLIIEEINS